MSNMYYSIDNEWYGYDELEDAVGACELGVVTIWQGESAPVKASDFISSVEDELAGRAYDEFGDHIGDWPNSTKEQNIELNAMIEKAVDEWANKNNLQPKFFNIINIKELKVNVLEDGGYEIINTPKG